MSLVDGAVSSGCATSPSEPRSRNIARGNKILKIDTELPRAAVMTAITVADLAASLV